MMIPAMTVTTMTMGTVASSGRSKRVASTPLVYAPTAKKAT
jgi:hypothetical protein